MGIDAYSNPKQIEVGKIRFNNPGKLLFYLVGDFYMANEKVLSWWLRLIHLAEEIYGLDDPWIICMLMICVDDMFGGTTENVVLNEVWNQMLVDVGSIIRDCMSRWWGYHGPNSKIRYSLLLLRLPAYCCWFI